MRAARVLWSFLVRLVGGVEVAAGGIATGGLRSVLTVLGVAIGVAAVASLLSVGQGARRAVAAQYESLGTNVITVESHDPSVALTDATAQQLASRLPTVTAVMPVVGVSAPVYWRRSATQGVSGLSVLGVTPQLLAIHPETVAVGRFLSELEQQHGLHVAVLGSSAASALFGGLDPVDQDILIGQAPFRVIGVLAPQHGATVGSGTVPVLGGSAASSTSSTSSSSSGSSGSGGGSSQTAQSIAIGSGLDSAVLIPESTAEWLAGTQQVSAIWMKARSGADVEPAVLQSQRILALLFNLSPTLQATGGGPGQFGPFFCCRPSGSALGGGTLVTGATGGPAVSVQSLNALVTQADAANRVLSVMLAAIAGVSLLVGGIGVMNIMLVSVRERTVEIGLRKAMGALQADLLYQFVLEALLLSGLGGICGWLAGFGGIRVLQHYGVAAAPLPGGLGVALAAAAGVGVLFGAYPAYLASELEPVEALRRQ
jgi:putative ABC transport system permease protein